MSTKPIQPYDGDRLRIRIVGPQNDVLRFIELVEKLFKTRMFPSDPKPDWSHGGTRVYVTVPLKAVREADVDE